MLNEMHLTVQEETIDKYAFWVSCNLDIFFGATSRKRKSHPNWDGFLKTMNQITPACSNCSSACESRCSNSVRTS